MEQLDQCGNSCDRSLFKSHVNTHKRLTFHKALPAKHKVPHRASAEAGCLSRMCTRTLSADKPTRSPHSGQHRGSGLVFFICCCVEQRKWHGRAGCRAQMAELYRDAWVGTHALGQARR